MSFKGGSSRHYPDDLTSCEMLVDQVSKAVLTEKNYISIKKIHGKTEFQSHRATPDSPMSFIWLFLGRSERRGYPVSLTSRTGETSENRPVNISINWLATTSPDLNLKSLWYQVFSSLFGLKWQISFKVPTLIRLNFIKRSEDKSWPVREPKIPQ